MSAYAVDPPAYPQNSHWLWRNKFYGITQIAGFGFINATRSRCEKAFWYILVIGFTAVMLRDVINLVFQWQDNKTVTSMTVHSNKTIQIPYSTLCLLAKLPDYNWGYPLAMPNPVSRYPWWDELNKSLESLDSKSKFLESNWVQDHYHLIPLANRYFAFLTHSENVHETSDFMDSINYLASRTVSDNDDHFVPNERYPAGKATKLLRQKASDLGVTEQEFSQKFAKEVGNLFGLSIYWRTEGKRRGQELFDPSTARLSWTDGSKICFQLDFGANIFLGAAKVLVFSASFNKVSQMEAMPKYASFGTTRNTENVRNSRMDFYLNWAVPPAEVADLTVLYRHHKKAALSIDKILINHVSNGCSLAYKTLHQCEKFCRTMLISSLCDCVPFTQGGASVDNTTCSMLQYLSCLKYGSEDDQQCKESCEPPCERANYRLDEKLSQRIEKVQGNPNRLITFILAYQRADYPVFEENYANEWQNFVGDLGGIVDFWLGTSFIGIIHLAVHILKQCFYCGDKHRENRRDANGNVSQILKEASPAIPGTKTDIETVA